jgi:hypothetical protein
MKFLRIFLCVLFGAVLVFGQVLAFTVWYRLHNGMLFLGVMLAFDTAGITGLMFARGYFMKRKAAGALLIGVSIVLLSCGGMPKTGNGNSITSERAVSSFDRVHVAANALVRIHLAEETRVIVSADSNLNEFIGVETKKNTLEIKTRPARKYSHPHFTVDVYSPIISGVSVKGPGSIELVDKISAPSFRVNSTGDGSITGAIECGTFEANMVGSCVISVTGSAERAGINVVGEGTFNGKDFKLIHADIVITGEGSITLWATDSLTSTITGSGEVKYRGDPVIDFSGAGSCRFVRFPDEAGFPEGTGLSG